VPPTLQYITHAHIPLSLPPTIPTTTHALPEARSQHTIPYDHCDQLSFPLPELDSNDLLLSGELDLGSGIDYGGTLGYTVLLIPDHCKLLQLLLPAPTDILA
jgi:hypothetical protein